MRLDDLTPPIHPFAVKIDTQGAEPLIFEGGRKMLASADLLICEFWPWGIKRAGLSPQVLIETIPSLCSSGRILRGEIIGPNLSQSVLRDQMQKLLDSGRSRDSVDIVLVR